MGDENRPGQYKTVEYNDVTHKTKKTKWIIWIIVIVLVTNAITLLVSTQISLRTPNGKVIIGRDAYDQVVKFQKLFLVRNKLYKYYDGKISDEVLVEGAIKGMTNSLEDPYTVFMNKKEYAEFNATTVGVYTGLGLQVGVKENNIVVIAPFDPSPAKSAGILPGDVIEKVNGTAVTGKELEKAVTMMKGKENEAVNLTLSRKDKGSFEVSVKRAKIDMVTVKGEMLDKNIGYIQLTMFDENTAKNFNKKLMELKGKGMKSLVLDLRGNPGGLLNQCVDLTSNFVPEGKVLVYTIDKNKEKTEYKSKGGLAVGMPLTVLTDEGSASASEIFAGAIRDYKVGTLVGEKTFGKGIVQTMFSRDVDGFDDGTALKVTISKYYTPNGENIHHIGIKPEVEVVYPKALKEKAYDRTLDPQFKKALEIAKGKIK
ncbi:S41 family peptidase [Clostridium tagluense]|uniref:S41 family peptidase n=1 Tax=Clostridium TaxID=1485 RepID=UPI0013E96D5B|nr:MULTISPECIES: S41 family peptidase [Clostridium]MBU3126927.1 S41 family peptidase [Clostridium tagluense]MBW9155596.1 S41 family peptidase [Clostridium tagluense]MBZ9625412.1 S41 family peptidase [Clostridium sp. FP2]MCB2299418.1 S41 family peptidase [Clostridium tagluense]MCB2313593.1 S41 family peptidase [Clostridium tagluense]